MAIEIIPAIMVKDRYELEEDVALVRGHVSLVQIDVMDGKFVPKKSWPYEQYNGYTVDFQQLIAESEGLPFWQEVDYELDLMIQNPEESIEDWIASGAKRIILHVESSAKLGELLADLRKRFPKGLTDTVATLEIGLALNTATSNDALAPYIEHADFVQFMGIERIGSQGQPFDPRVLEKISTLRKQYPELIISVDGAVNFDTAPQLKQAGVNRLVSGSAIFESEDIVGAIKELRNISS